MNLLRRMLGIRSPAREMFREGQRMMAEELMPLAAYFADVLDGLSGVRPLGEDRTESHTVVDLHEDPHWRVVELTCIDVLTTYQPADPELWLNPGDWDLLGQPAAYMDLPVKTSAGVPAGTARIFDRATLRYLPPARP